MKEDLEKEKNRLQEEARGFEKSPFVFFVRKNKLTYLIIAFLLIFGVASIRSLPKELNPEVEIPIALIVTAYPGASPVDVESQVTDKIEAEVGTLEGIKNLTSTSGTGISTVTVEFEAGEELNDSIRTLKDNVNEVNDLPDDALSPNVIEISLSDQPIFVAAITSEKYDIVELKNFAENIKNRLEGIPFVSEARVIGGREKEIRVDVNFKKLADYGLSISQILNVISASNADVPIGSVEIGDSHYLVRMSSQLKTAQEIGSIRVATNEEKPVYLEDVAEVREELNDVSSISQISVGGGESSEAVSIQIYKRTGGDITALAEEARKRIEDGKGRDYPADAQVIVTLDLSEYITESINTLLGNGMQTVVLILILLFFFLGFKEALIAGLAVPFSFFVAFISMSVFGESLNFLSLFSLVLALGLLVDSAIVIVEGMYEKVARYGVSGYEAAILTIKEYAAPLVSGMLTTVAAFLPLLFVIGIFGQFMKTIPVVVISTLTAALFVSLTIIPAVGAFFMNPVKESSGSPENSIFQKSLFRKICRRVRFFCKSKPRRKRIATRFFDWGAGKYYDFLPKLIGSKKQRVKLIVGTWLLFLISLALPALGLLKIQSFVPTDAEYFFINLEMPNGTVLEKTSETTRKIENVLRQENQILNFVTSIGSSSGFSGGFSGGGGGTLENQANIQANLTKKETRDETSAEIVSRIRRELQAEITEGEISIQEEQSGPPTGAAVEVRVQGDDIQILSGLAEQLRSDLADIPTVIDAKTSLSETSGEFVFYPNKEIMARNGFSPVQVGLEIRNAVNRNSEQNIKIDGDEIAINVGAREDTIETIEGIKDIRLTSSSGKTMFVSELGQIEIGASLSAIDHFDEKRTVSVTAGTDGGNPTEIASALREKIDAMDLPSGYSIEFGGESEELQEVFADMFTKMIIGVILILFILVIQFNSYRQVLIILLTIPLAMIGVIWGMTLTRLIVDIPAFIGVVSLTGIVVNNAIILIDEINREIRGGKYVVDAVRDAGRTRLRPVFLTTITTIFGLLPLSITQPDWRNMGFSIIFGLSFATFLTLVIIPTFYISFYRGKLREENL
jgi:multidrug efflux pump subunit AcrB